ncbi:MAG: 3-isopropylmalate dehydratase large subunit [Candidatus Bipolaricaulota bacterium]
MTTRTAMTVSEKILTQKTGKKVEAGEIVVADLDLMMFHDGTFHLVTEAWHELENGKVAKPESVVMVIDHSAPPPTASAANLHNQLRDFAEEHDLKLYDSGEGICHQLVPEGGHVVPGDLVVGADSHTTTYGGVNAFSTGVGATDLASALHTGKLWFKVPETIRVNLHGELNDGVYSKDLILYMAGELTADGATYKTLEYGGEGLKSLSIPARFTVSNMAIELGGKAGIMEPDEKALDWVSEHSDKEPNPVEPDEGADYERVMDIDLGDIEPSIAAPHEVDNVSPLTELEGTDIDQAFVGTCTNGRLEDLKEAAKIAEGNEVADDVRFIVAAASQDIYQKAMNQGILNTLTGAGATVIAPGCGPCLGTHNGIPGDDEMVISTANRNFKGRMGNESAGIYLGSPATVMASAIEGKITDPRNYV